MSLKDVYSCSHVSPMFHMPGFLPLTAARPSHIIWSKDQVWSKVSMAWFCGEKILLNPLFFMIFITPPKTKGPVVVLFQCSLQPIRGKLLKWCGYGRISQGPPWSGQSKDRLSSWYSTSLEASTLIECVFVCSRCAWAKTASCLIYGTSIGWLFDPQSAEMPSATFMQSGNCSCIVT